jgi:photosystem II stability/assembly factor-like uncharacterized protein
MSASRRLVFPAVVVLLALPALACSAVSRLQPTELPGPATVVAGVTLTFAAASTQATAAHNVPPSATAPVVPASPTVAATITPPPATAPGLPPIEGEPFPHLAAGQPVTLTMVDMTGAGLGWAIGYGAAGGHDHILRTTDGGLTWQDVSPPEPAGEGLGRAAVGAFTAGEAAWVTYYDRDIAPADAAYVWRTLDGGQTWTPSAPLDMRDMEFFSTSDLYFAGLEHGWLLAHVGAGMNHDYVVAFATADGGATWTRVVDPFAFDEGALQQSCLKTGLAFLDGERGWVTGDCQGVAPGLFFYVTDDGGRTWREQPLPPPAAMPDAFTRPDGGCGTYNPALPEGQVRVAVTCVTYAETLEIRHFLYVSSDRGETWEAHALPARDFTWLTASTGWTVEPTDPNNPEALRRVYQTTDGGLTWTEITTVAWSARLDFVDPLNGWAVARADDGIALVRSSDGGASWALLTPIVQP